MISTYTTRILINVILLTSLIAAQGCASKRKPLSETLIAETPTIGVVLRPTDSDADLQIPSKGWRGRLWVRLASAGRGALGGSLIGGLGVHCGFGLFLCVPALATVGAVGGAIYGAATAEPALEGEQSGSSFKDILSDLQLQQRVPDHVVEFAQSQTLYRVVRVEIEGLSSKDEKGAYRTLASKGIDAVLELTEVTVHLRPSEFAVNPRRKLMMDARARLIRTSDGSLLDERVITDDDSCAAWSLVTWANPNELLFREEATESARRLAQEIVKDLLSDTRSSNEMHASASQSFNR